MVIRTVQESDYIKLVELYHSFFPTHNVFQKPKNEVISYLKQQTQENELIVYDDGKLKGALYLVNFGQNSDGSHKLWKFRHFVFENEKVFSQLLKEAEKRVRKASKTSKIELTIAETERGMDSYLANGYVREAMLSHHYRWGETCFILGKAFG